jgi:putative FmdB family regulatory protein
MPFYEYECDNCKYYVELLQKVSDEPLRKCPSCGKNAMKKLVSAPVFRLKGSGWYETDFKGDKDNKRNLAVDKEPESASSDEKPAAASSEKATEAKPAETKAAEPKVAAGGSRASGSRKPAASASRASAASKSRSKAPPARAKAKPKAKPAARRKGR